MNFKTDFDASKINHRSHADWQERASSARVAFAPFGGGPYYGYQVGVIDAMHELGVVPDAYLPGCIGNFLSIYHMMAVTEDKHPAFYIDQFSAGGLMAEKDYLKAPIPPLFPMRITEWMQANFNYFGNPGNYKDLLAPELFPAVYQSWSDFLARPTKRNFGIWCRNFLVSHPLYRLTLGAYFFSPIGAFGELYDHENTAEWIEPKVNWGNIYRQGSPVMMMSILPVGNEHCQIATNCIGHPSFAPIDGRRLASASNLPWLISETEIDGVWHRESAVRHAATIVPAALDSLPNLELIIAVKIMSNSAANRRSSEQGNHDNYALQVTEMISGIGEADIQLAKQHLKSKGREVQWIVVESTSNAKPHWTFENVRQCREEGYRLGMEKLKESRFLTASA
ncbi:alpha/beta hydrolase [Pandoraea anhela]|uniref:PNPLA domain-containing protein n=1 Tax=Pandoraea anhela TaxID=2508295 RepID=A0A5E4R896_9BURK|nr:alpha/beta hydrolase [Pandoraea anhela]VVD59367.1 hypothetical protein PAN31108_00025 [Pandoraea anhela]